MVCLCNHTLQTTKSDIGEQLSQARPSFKQLSPWASFLKEAPCEIIFIPKKPCSRADDLTVWVNLIFPVLLWRYYIPEIWDGLINWDRENEV